MKKQFQSVVSALIAMALVLCCVLCLPVPASADSNGLTYSINYYGTTITGCIQNMTGPVVIPDRVLGKNVHTIESYAFSGCSGVTYVYIPNTVQYMGSGIFKNCTSLYAVDFPVLANEIPAETFYGCASLGEFTFGPNIRTIRKHAFAGSGLWELIIPDNVTTILEGAFQDCVALNHVTLGSGVEKLRPYTFENCVSLESLYLKSNLKYIEDSAFRNADNINVVFYEGNREDLTIGSDNGNLESAQWHCGVTKTQINSTECFYCPECNAYMLPDGEIMRATVEFFYVGILIDQQEYQIGQMIVPPPMEDLHIDEALYERFEGWSPEVGICMGEMQYHAIYELAEYVYNVTFQYPDGTVISSEDYHYNDEVTPPADPATPEELADEYIFAGWDKTVTNCSGNTVYTAVFEKKSLPGDFNADDTLDDTDAIYLLRHSIMPNRYPVYQDGDVNGDGECNDADAIYLLRHIMLPYRYPLYPNQK